MFLLSLGVIFILLEKQNKTSEQYLEKKVTEKYYLKEAAKKKKTTKNR